MESKLTKNQKKVYGWKSYVENGTTYRIRATVRYDDDCGNGQNSFSVTGDIDRKASNGRWMEDSGGSIHDEIGKHFPELIPFFKWHLMSSDGPMHYLANTRYFAGNRDSWGKLKGEPRTWETKIRFGTFPMLFEYEKRTIEFLQSLSKEQLAELEVMPVEHKREPDGYKYAPKWTFTTLPCEWYQCPFDNEAEAIEFLDSLNWGSISFDMVATDWGEGKEREFDKARSAAIWPEATEEELSASREVLTATLEARLPALIEAFRKDMESLGLTF